MMFKFTYLYSISITLLFIVSSCGIFKEYGKLQDPVVRVESAKITDLSFKDIKLVLKLKIHNPNVLPVNLSGFDYKLEINNNKFLNGEQDQPTEVKALGDSYIDFPIQLQFKEILNTLGSVVTSDELSYLVAMGLHFDIPVLGKIRVPIKHSDNLPFPKLPSVKVSSLKLEKINMIGALLNLQLEVDNPNTFQLDLTEMNLDFNINSQNWVSTQLTNKDTIKEKETNKITIPISLDFFKMGTTLHRLISGNNNVNFNLTGDFKITTSNSLIPPFLLNFKEKGEIKIAK